MDFNKLTFNELCDIYSALVTAKEVLLLSEEPKADYVYYESLDSLDKCIDFFRSRIIEVYPDWVGVI